MGSDSAFTVHVFEAITGGPAPFIARIRCPMVGAKGKLVETWHPVIFEAGTAEAANDRATAWWNAEVEKERRKADNREAQSARMRAARQAKASPDQSEGGR